MKKVTRIPKYRLIVFFGVKERREIQVAQKILVDDNKQYTVYYNLFYIL